jgi:hypothetical protein
MAVKCCDHSHCQILKQTKSVYLKTTKLMKKQWIFHDQPWSWTKLFRIMKTNATNH